MKAGTVTALAREAPCGSAQASRTNCRFSFWTRSLSSSACRRCSSLQRSCLSIKDCGAVIGCGAIPDIRAIVREVIDLDQTFCRPLVAQALDLGHPQPHPSWGQSAGRPLRQAPKGGRRGKSGLHGRTVPDNVRRGPIPAQAGINLRESATESRPPSLTPQGSRAVRVKGCGKSAPRRRQRRRHGKPHREQDRIGTARSASSGIDVWILPSG